MSDISDEFVVISKKEREYLDFYPDTKVIMNDVIVDWLKASQRREEFLVTNYDPLEDSSTIIIHSFTKRTVPLW